MIRDQRQSLIFKKERFLEENNKEMMKILKLIKKNSPFFVKGKKHSFIWASNRSTAFPNRNWDTNVLFLLFRKSYRSDIEFLVFVYCVWFKKKLFKNTLHFKSLNIFIQNLKHLAIAKQKDVQANNIKLYLCLPPRQV